ncbi:hypothetical protein DSECCO2_288330 [anaerobic digester metagenome]
MTMGVPRPPLRTMEPSGAPMKKNTRQAKGMVNFRCHSIHCRFIFRCVVVLDIDRKR